MRPHGCPGLRAPQSFARLPGTTVQAVCSGGARCHTPQLGGLPARPSAWAVPQAGLSGWCSGSLVGLPGQAGPEAALSGG